MRRYVLKTLFGTSSILFSNAVFPANPKTETDSRLLGTWRSDKERTVALWKYRKEISKNEREKFEKIFGKFTLRFTPTHVHTEFDGTKDTMAYTVIARDSSSVVIALRQEETDSLQHIHFDGEHYYVLSGYNVEFYKRVSDK